MKGMLLDRVRHLHEIEMTLSSERGLTRILALILEDSRELIEADVQ